MHVLGSPSINDFESRQVLTDIKFVVQPCCHVALHMKCPLFVSNLPTGWIFRGSNPWKGKWFLGAFAKFRKATITFFVSIRLSVRMEQHGSQWTDFD